MSEQRIVCGHVYAIGALCAASDSDRIHGDRTLAEWHPFDPITLVPCPECGGSREVEVASADETCWWEYGYSDQGDPIAELMSPGPAMSPCPRCTTNPDGSPSKWPGWVVAASTAGGAA